MPSSNKLLKIVSSFLVFTMVIQDLLWANPEIKLVLPQAPSSALKLPEEFGRVIETYSAPASNKIIYLIQDAHTNESAQKNIARILDELIDKEKIKYVFLEAGTGDDSLSSLRPLAPAAKRKSVADIYLKKAWIQGPDYLDLTSDQPLQLWGVEDKSLYFRGIELYRRLVKERESANAFLDKIERSLRTLKPKLFSPALLEFDSKRAGYLKGELPVTDYFDVLSSESGKQGISLLGYPALLALKEVRGKESRIDFKKSNEELQKIFLTLEGGERAEFLAALNRQAESSRKGTAELGKLADIYISLKSKIGDSELYPDFSRYVDYLQAMQKVEDAAFLRELHELEASLAESLTTNEIEGALLEITRSTELLRRLINLQAGSDDIRALNEKPASFDPVEIGGRLNRELVLLQSHYEDAIFLDKEYGEAFKAAKEFYALTEERDDAFIRNILQKMSDEKTDKAAFVSGGFHAESLTKKLKEKGISYISILPRVLQETNQKRYENLLLNQPAGMTTAVSVSSTKLWNTLPAAQMRVMQDEKLVVVKELLQSDLTHIATVSQRVDARLSGGQARLGEKIANRREEIGDSGLSPNSYPLSANAKGARLSQSSESGVGGSANNTHFYRSRAFDLMAAPVLGILLLVPALISVALLWVSGRKPFFVEERLGFNGQLFNIVKLRTLNDIGTSQRRIRILGILPLGSLMQKFMIDETPQILWNVLRGKMALIGPRPPTREEVSRLDRMDPVLAREYKKNVLSMRPGIFGLFSAEEGAWSAKAHMHDYVILDIFRRKVERANHEKNMGFLQFISEYRQLASKRLGREAFREAAEIETGRPEGFLAYEKKLSYAKNTSIRIAIDIAHAGELQASAIIRSIQKKRKEFDEKGRTERDVFVVFATGNTQWMGLSILKQWLDDWGHWDDRTKRFLELSGVDLTQKPDMGRVFASHLDTIFPQSKNEYFSYANELNHAFDRLGIAAGKRQMFYGDGGLESAAFEAVLRSVDEEGLKIDEFLAGSLPKDHPQYAYLEAMNRHAQDISKTILERGGADILFFGVGPSYSGEGHIAFNEKGTPLAQGVAMSLLSYHAAAGNIKERTNGMAEFKTKDGKIKIGGVTLGPKELLENPDAVFITTITGKEKKNTARNLIEEEMNEKFPATYLQLGGKGSVVILESSSASALRFSTHPWEFRKMDPTAWTREMKAQFFIQLSKDTGKPIHELTPGDLKDGTGPDLASWEILRAETEKGVSRILRPNEVSKVMGLSPGKPIVHIGPHLDDISLAAQFMITQWADSARGEGRRMDSFYTAPGYTAVTDQYVLAAFKTMTGFSQDELEELLRESRDKFLFAENEKKYIRDLVAVLSAKETTADPDNYRVWDLMSTEEQTLRAKIFLLRINSMDEFKDVFNRPSKIEEFYQLLTRSVSSKRLWGSSDPKAMQIFKVILRFAEEQTELMSRGVPYDGIHYPINSSFYRGLEKGTVGQSDIDRMKAIFLEKRPSLIVVNGEGFMDHGAHSVTEMLVKVALKELIDEGALENGLLPNNLMLFQYRGVWDRAALKGLPQQLIVGLTEQELQENKDSFGRNYPSQRPAVVPDASVDEPMFFSDQVVTNATETLREYVELTGDREKVKPYAGLLAFDMVQLGDKNQLKEFLATVEEKERELERVRGPIENSSLSLIIGAKAPIADASAIEQFLGARLSGGNDFALKIAAGYLLIIGFAAVAYFGGIFEPTHSFINKLVVNLGVFSFFTALADALSQWALGQKIDRGRVLKALYFKGPIMGAVTTAGYAGIDFIMPRHGDFFGLVVLPGFVAANIRTLLSFIVVKVRTVIYSRDIGDLEKAAKQSESFWVARFPSYIKNYLIQAVFPAHLSVAAEAVATQFFQLFYSWSVYKKGFMVANQRYRNVPFLISYFFVGPFVYFSRKSGFFQRELIHERRVSNNYLWNNPAKDRASLFRAEQFSIAHQMILEGLVETPLTRAKKLSEMSRKEVYVKDESFQNGGSFKMRGVSYEVYAAIERLIQSGEPGRGLLRRGVKIVTQSTGNHGIAMIRSVTSVVERLSKKYENDPELVAWIRNIEPVVFTVETLPDVKRNDMVAALKDYRKRIRADGGEIKNSYHNYEGALAARIFYITENLGRALYMDHSGEDIMLGHGSAAIEIIKQLKRMNIPENRKVVILIPVGAGGPLGIAAAMKHFRKNVSAVMVQSRNWDAFVRTLQTGRRQKNEAENWPTITAQSGVDKTELIFVDGIAVDGPEGKAVEVAKTYLDAAVSVNEKRAYESSGPILYADLQRQYGADADVKVGGTTAITAEALLTYGDAIPAIRDADIVILFGTEGNVAAPVLDHLKSLSVNSFGARMAKDASTELLSEGELNQQMDSFEAILDKWAQEKFWSKRPDTLSEQLAERMNLWDSWAFEQHHFLSRHNTDAGLEKYRTIVEKFTLLTDRATKIFVAHSTSLVTRARILHLRRLAWGLKGDLEDQNNYPAVLRTYTEALNMELFNSHPSAKELVQIREVLERLGPLWLKLFIVERGGAKDRGVPEIERWQVGDHTLLLLGLLNHFITKNADFKDDVFAMIEYIALHDVPEIITGDTTPVDKERWENKKEIEHQAVLRLQLLLKAEAKQPRSTARIWKRWITRYERQADDKTRFVKQMDKLGSLVELLVYAERYPATAERFLEPVVTEKLHQWHDYRLLLKFPALINFYYEIDRIRWEEWNAGPRQVVDMILRNLEGLKDIRKILKTPHYNERWHKEGGLEAILKDHLGQGYIVLSQAINEVPIPSLDASPILKKILTEQVSAHPDDMNAAILTHDIGKHWTAVQNPHGGWSFLGHEEMSYSVLRNAARIVYKAKPLSKKVILVARYHDWHWKLRYESGELDRLLRAMREDYNAMGGESSEHDFRESIEFLIAFSTIDMLAGIRESGQPGNLNSVQKFSQEFEKWKGEHPITPQGARLSTRDRGMDRMADSAGRFTYRWQRFDLGRRYANQTIEIDEVSSAADRKWFSERVHLGDELVHQSSHMKDPLSPEDRLGMFEVWMNGEQILMFDLATGKYIKFLEKRTSSESGIFMIGSRHHSLGRAFANREVELRITDKGWDAYVLGAAIASFDAKKNEIRRLYTYRKTDSKGRFLFKNTRYSAGEKYAFKEVILSFSGQEPFEPYIDFELVPVKAVDTRAGARLGLSKPAEGLAHERKTFSLNDRDEMLGELIRDAGQQKVRDVLVIGGGIAGANIARELALRGVSATLAEKNDFASGTSSSSTELIHAGIRYLELAWDSLRSSFRNLAKLEFKSAWNDLKGFYKNLRLVYAASAERKNWRRIAPDLVRAIMIYIPVYKSGTKSIREIFTGVVVYSLFSRQLFRPHFDFSAVRALERFSDLEKDGLVGGFEHYDAVTDDSLLTRRIIRDAYFNGATTLNYLEVKSWERGSKDSPYEVKFLDPGSGREFTAKFRQVVDARGPSAGGYLLRLSRGIHIQIKDTEIVKKFKSPFLIENAVLGKDGKKKERVYFVIPKQKRGVVYLRIGTTEEDAEGPEDRYPTLEGIKEIVEALQKVFPDLKILPENIRTADGGIRPLYRDPDAEGKDAGQISREHHISVDPETGVIRVIGVKLTDGRRAGQEAGDLIVRYLGYKNKPSRSVKTPLKILPQDETLERPGEDSKLSAQSLKEWIEYLTQYEMLFNFSDFMFLHDADIILDKNEDIEKASKILADILNQSEPERLKQFELYRQELEKRTKAVHEWASEGAPLGENKIRFLEPIPAVKNRRFALTPAEMRTAYKVKKAAENAMKGLRNEPGFKLTEDHTYYGIYAPAEMGRALSGLKAAGVGSSSTVLDLGHGEGILAHGMAAVLGADVTGIEANPEYFNRSLKAHEVLLAMEELNASKVHLLKENFLKPSWKDFDFVYYYSHGSRSKEELAMKAAAEMKPGAKFILFGERDKEAPDTHYDEAVVRALLDTGLFELTRYPEYGTWVFEKTGARLGENQNEFLRSKTGQAADEYAKRGTAGAVRWDFGRSKEARDYLLSRFDKLYAIDPATLLNDWERERFSEHVGVAEKALSRLDRIIEAKDIYISPAIIHTRKDYALGYSENDKFILTKELLEFETPLLAQLLFSMAISSETDDRYIPYKVGDYLFGENLDTSRTKDEQQGLVPNYIITALVEKLSPPAPTKEEIKQYSNTMQKDFPSVKTLYFDEINSGFTWQQLDNAINGVLRSKETHIIFGNWESITWRPLSPKSEKQDVGQELFKVLILPQEGLVGIWDMSEKQLSKIRELSKSLTAPVLVPVYELYYVLKMEAYGYEVAHILRDMVQRQVLAFSYPELKAMARHYLDIYKKYRDEAAPFRDADDHTRYASILDQSAAEGRPFRRLLWMIGDDNRRTLLGQLFKDTEFEDDARLLRSDIFDDDWVEFLWNLYMDKQNSSEDIVRLRKLLLTNLYDRERNNLEGEFWRAFRDMDSSSRVRAVDLMLYLKFGEEEAKNGLWFLEGYGPYEETLASFSLVNLYLYGIEMEFNRDGRGEDYVTQHLTPKSKNVFFYALKDAEFLRSNGMQSKGVDPRIISHTIALDDHGNYPGANGHTWFSSLRQDIHRNAHRGHYDEVRNALRFWLTFKPAMVGKNPEIDQHMALMYNALGPGKIERYSKILGTLVKELYKKGQITSADPDIFLKEVVLINEEVIAEDLERVNKKAMSEDVRKVEHMLRLYFAFVEKFSINLRSVVEEISQSSALSHFYSQYSSEKYDELRAAIAKGEPELILKQLADLMSELHQKILESESTNIEEGYEKEIILYLHLNLLVYGRSLISQLLDDRINKVASVEEVLKAAPILISAAKFIRASGLGGVNFEQFVDELEMGDLTVSQLHDLVRALRMEVHKATRRINENARRSMVHLEASVDYDSLLERWKNTVKTRIGKNSYGQKMTFVTEEGVEELKNNIVDELVRESGLTQLDQILIRFDEVLSARPSGLDDPPIRGITAKSKGDPIDGSFYRFGEGAADKKPPLLSLWSKKGLNLVRMTEENIPVPPGVILSAKMMTQPDIIHSEPFKARVMEEIEHLRQFSTYPDLRLLLYARSGSAFMLPGLLITVPNIGMNDEEAEKFSAGTGDAWFAYDTYAEFIRSFSINILDIPESEFDAVFDVQIKDQLSAEQMKEVIEKYKGVLARQKKAIPHDMMDQVMMAVDKVYASWDSEDAKAYRERHKISQQWGTVVILQKGVFGNINKTVDGLVSGTGAGALRVMPAGEAIIQGKFRFRSIGDQMMSRAEHNYLLLSNSQRIANEQTLEDLQPKIYEDILDYAQKLKSIFGHEQHFEFTIERGKIWITQSNDDFRRDDYSEFSDEAVVSPIARGHGVSGGAVRGWTAGTIEKAADLLQKFQTEKPDAVDGVILLVDRVNPEFINRIPKGVHLLAKTMSVHAETLAQNYGISAVYGISDMEQASDGIWKIGGTAIPDGTVISMDGHENQLVYHNSGNVYLGSVALKTSGARLADEQVLSDDEDKPIYRIESSVDLFQSEAGRAAKDIDLILLGLADAGITDYPKVAGILTKMNKNHSFRQIMESLLAADARPQGFKFPIEGFDGAELRDKAKVVELRRLLAKKIWITNEGEERPFDERAELIRYIQNARVVAGGRLAERVLEQLKETDPQQRKNSVSRLLFDTEFSSLRDEIALLALMDPDTKIRKQVADWMAQGNKWIPISPEVLLRHLAEPVKESLKAFNSIPYAQFDEEQARRNKRYAILFALSFLVKEGKIDVETQLEKEATQWTADTDRQLERLAAQKFVDDTSFGTERPLTLLEALRLVRLRDSLKSAHTSDLWKKFRLLRLTGKKTGEKKRMKDPAAWLHGAAVSVTKGLDPSSQAYKIFRARLRRGWYAGGGESVMRSSEKVILVDENNIPTGETKDISQAHMDGDWHRISQVLGIHPESGKLVLHRRSDDMVNFPGKVDIFGGHNTKGDDELATALKEAQQELHPSIRAEQLVLVENKGSFKHERGRNREFRTLYLVTLTDEQIADIERKSAELKTYSSLSAEERLAYRQKAAKARGISLEKINDEFEVKEYLFYGLDEVSAMHGAAPADFADGLSGYLENPDYKKKFEDKIRSFAGARLASETADLLIRKYEIDKPKAERLAEVIRSAKVEKDGALILIVSQEGKKLVEISKLGSRRFFDEDGRWIMTLDPHNIKIDELKWEDDKFVSLTTLHQDLGKVSLRAPYPGEPVSYAMYIEYGQEFEIFGFREPGLDLNNAGAIPHGHRKNTSKIPLPLSFTYSPRYGLSDTVFRVVAILAKDQKHNLSYIGDDTLDSFYRALSKVITIPDKFEPDSRGFIDFFKKNPNAFDWIPDPPERIFNFDTNYFLSVRNEKVQRVYSQSVGDDVGFGDVFIFKATGEKAVPIYLKDSNGIKIADMGVINLKGDILAGPDENMGARLAESYSVHRTTFQLIMAIAKRDGIDVDEILKGRILNVGLESYMLKGLTDENLVTYWRSQGVDMVGLDPQAPQDSEHGMWKGVVQSMPFSDDHFDAAVSIGLFNKEFFDLSVLKEGQTREEFYSQAAKEFRRVLRKDGTLFLSTGTEDNPEFFAALTAEGFENFELKIKQHVFVLVNKKSDMASATKTGGPLLDADAPQGARLTEVQGSRLSTISNLKALMTAFFMGIAFANPQVSNAQVPLKTDLNASAVIYEYSKKGSEVAASFNGEQIVADISNKAVAEHQGARLTEALKADGVTVADIKAKVDIMNQQVSVALETAGLSQDKPVIVDIDLGFIEGKSFDAYSKNLIAEIKALKRRDDKAMFRLSGKENLVQNALDEPSAQGVFTQDISKDFESATRVNLFSPDISSAKSGSVNVPAQSLDEAAPAFQAMLQLAVALGRVDTRSMPSGLLDAWSTLAGQHLTTQIAGDIADGRADLATMKLYSLKPVLEKVGEYLRYMSLRLRQLGQSA